MYLILKNFHIAFATLAIAGFLLRGYWQFSGSALRKNRALAFAAAVASFVYVVGAALKKSPLSWLAMTS